MSHRTKLELEEMIVRFQTQRDEALQQLAALRAEREWIPVSERLPDKPGRYLTLRGNQYDLDLFTDGFRDWWYNDGVTHWMPLPAPQTK